MVLPPSVIFELNVFSPISDAVGAVAFDIVGNRNLKPHKLHIESIKFVKAKSQANTLKRIEDFLTDEEKDIVRRGRNAENHHIPKNAEPADYMYSTAFEALIGYLYLTKKDERLKEIFGRIDL